MGRLITSIAVAATALVGLTALPAAALSPTTFDSTMWQVNGRVQAIVETPTATIIAGTFTALVGPNGETVPRSNLAAIDPTTGAPLPQLFDVNKPVYAIAVSSDYSTLYAVGDFNLANAVSRKRAAAFDTATGTTLAWNPNLGARGLSLAVLGSRVYVGGQFVTINGTLARNHLAAVDATTGALVTAWTATANDNVDSIAVANDGSKVFVGGLFTGISGSPGSTQRKIAALNPSTGALLPWASHPTYEVFDLEVSGTQVFAAAGGAGGHAMAYDIVTGNQQWAGFGDGDAVAVELQNDVLYIGGHMTTWGGVAASHVLAVNPATGARIPWTVKINSNLGIFSMTSFKGHLSIGGDFTRVNNLARQHYARFNENLDPIPPTTPGKPSVSDDSATSAVLTWAASTDNVATSIIYTIFRDDPDNPVGQLTSSSTTTVSFTDTGLGLQSTHTWLIQASDGVNVSPLSPASDPYTLPPSDVPLLTGLTMLDNDVDGKVDTVTATFSSAVSCTDPCLSPWTLANVPSGGTLSSVSVSGDTATLNLTEGPGPQATDVGSFTVALAASPTGIVDTGADAASFDPTAPADGARPVPVSYDSTDGVTPNFMEPGDTFSVTFSEPIDPSTVHAANVKELDPAGTFTDRIIIVGLTDGAMDLLDDNIVIPNKGTIVYQQSTLTMLNGNTTIMSTVLGPCTGSGACIGGEGFSSSQPVTFVPEPTLRDFAGNGAGGSFTGQLAIF
jgi:hypothetical protein